MTFEEIKSIVAQITYRPGWEIRCMEDASKRPYVQIAVDTTTDVSLSPVTGKREPWKSGKHFLSVHMCRQEIVGAVFGVIRAAEEHEMREWFRYRGASIYNPHLDPDALVQLARWRHNFNLRENAMSMEEPADPGAEIICNRCGDRTNERDSPDGECCPDCYDQMQYED